ncbi:MAG: transglutaminase domain-containing protein [Deltaproteobacteria bacterium]|nr:transglutaminase domain-containing protein [Deltaproteobacteria bacterium]
MSWRTIITATVVACLVLAGGGGKEGQDAPAASAPPGPGLVTADIQAGIERHIEEQVSLGGGHFKLPFQNKELRLKLVRVHTEYLSNLGPGRYFACVDLVDISGDVYDVDFFLAGEPAAMKVTETTVHKINGQPYYAWEQKSDGAWHRIPLEKASEGHFGVIRDRDEFEFLYRATLPQITGAARMWLPLAATDSFQTVEAKSINAPGKRSILQEREYGNKVLFLELGPEDSGKNIEIRYQVQRLEKAAYAGPTPDQGKYLNPERLVPTDENFRHIAEEVVKGKKGDLVRARALYDHVIDRMRYMKHGDGWGKGDAVYACNARTGNCTDFHSYFIALARAVGIPASFAIGAAIPSERNEGGVDGYHCWAEFFADGKWWPVDISEADKYSSLATYYFGHHPANRLEFSRGRDLVVEPGPASGPINFLAYPVLEMGGKPAKAAVEFSFNRSGRR